MGGAHLFVIGGISFNGIIKSLDEIELIESTNGSSEGKVQKESSLKTYDSDSHKWFIVR